MTQILHTKSPVAPATSTRQRDILLVLGAVAFGSIYTGTLVWALLRPAPPVDIGCAPGEIRIYTQTITETALTCLPGNTKLYQKEKIKQRLKEGTYTGGKR